MSIFNKANLLDQILTGLFENTSSLVTEYIFILDGCTDGSGVILEEKIKTFDKQQQCTVLTAPNVFEIRSNNMGLKIATQPYVCIIQDDMLIKEKDWDRRLVKPFLYFDDVFAVTARTTVQLSLDAHWINGIEGPVGDRYGQHSNISRDKFYVGQTVNRGPLMFDRQRLASLGYLDETLPFLLNADDADVCFKAFIKHGWRCGTYWIGYYSPDSWGSTRSGPNSKYLTDNMDINVKEVVKRYRDVIINWNHNEVRDLPDSYPLYPENKQ